MLGRGEGLFSWRRLCYVLISIVVAQSIFLWTYSRDSRPSRVFEFPQYHEQVIYENTTATPPTAVSRETYSPQECQEEFPDLYFEIDWASAHWKNLSHIISKEDVNITWRDDGAARILIHDNELRILETKGVYENDGYRERMLSVLSEIQRALWSATAGGERLPTIETAIVVDDHSMLDHNLDLETRTLWTFTSSVTNEAHKRHWLVPDFNLYSSLATHSFGDMLRRAKQHDAHIIDKIPKLVWRGVLWTNEEIRGAFLKHAEKKPWADVAIVNWQTRENMMPMDENCDYAFTVHTEGRSYSGRLPFLLNCDSLPIIHPLTWTSHFYHLLVASGPKQNYVPVKKDYSDLEKLVKYYLNHPHEANQIIENSLATFREKYTTPPATSCYFRRLIAAYAEVAAEPEVDRPQADGKIIVKRRGIPFEEFVHLRRDYPYEEGEE